jgi:hypothetical protein
MGKASDHMPRVRDLAVIFQLFLKAGDSLIWKDFRCYSLAVKVQVQHCLGALIVPEYFGLIEDLRPI